MLRAMESERRLGLALSGHVLIACSRSIDLRTEQQTSCAVSGSGQAEARPTLGVCLLTT